MILSLKVLSILNGATKKSSSKTLFAVSNASSVCAPFVALHKSWCPIVNGIIYPNMLEFGLLSQLFQDKSKVVFQHGGVPSSTRKAVKCQHSQISSCLSNGLAKEGPLPDLPSLTTPNFFVKYKVYIWLMPAFLNFKDRIKTEIEKKSFGTKSNIIENWGVGEAENCQLLFTTACNFIFVWLLLPYLDISKTDNTLKVLQCGAGQQQRRSV